MDFIERCFVAMTVAGTAAMPAVLKPIERARTPYAGVEKFDVYLGNDQTFDLEELRRPSQSWSRVNPRNNPQT
jgi:hypothetical protein